MMEVLYKRVCGLDVHKKFLVACLICVADDGHVTKEIRKFSTMLDDLLTLADWLQAHGVTHVAMESTGVYWKPVYNVLEGPCDVWVVNAQHFKAVPGRKTDVRDGEWLAELLRHGLLRPSFVPAKPQRELRELTRYRSALIHERTREVNRLQKVLEGANIKLGAVASDVLGASGREMLAALVAGTTDTAALADLAKGTLRHKIPDLERALRGRFGDHQRFLIARQLAHIDALDATLEEVTQEIAARMRPFEAVITRWDGITGVGRRTAETLVAELGVDMGRWPSHQHLASWAGLCPGNDESAGKRKAGKTRKGNPWLRAALIEAAQAAGRTKDTYLGAQYHRLAARRGKKKAAMAVAHSILVIAYHLVKDDCDFADLGVHYFDERDRAAVQRHAVKRLERLGFKVTLEPVALAA